MPVYTRRNTLSPTAGSMIDQDFNDADFLLDPEQFRDTLPQPFRMVNKVLGNLIDNAWEIIADRERVRNEDASKIRPPQYLCETQVQVRKFVSSY